MKSARPLYRYPPAIISHAVWLDYKFGLSLRNVEDLLAERGIVVTHETMRRGTVKLTDFLEVPLIDMPAKSVIFRAG